MALPKIEDLTIWTLASLTKYFKEYGFGLPVIFMQQMAEQDVPTKDRLEIIYDGPYMSRAGSQNEIYGRVGVRIFVHTTLTPTDIYYHTRIKARAAEAISKTILLKKIGSPDYDRSNVGLLRPVPTETLVITPVSVDEPDGSIVEQLYNIEIC